MAERYERSHGRTVVGMQRMPAARALDAMEQAHMSELGHIGVMALDPHAWRARTQSDTSDPYLSELSSAAGTPAEAAAQDAGEAPLDLTAKLAAAAAGPRWPFRAAAAIGPYIEGC